MALADDVQNRIPTQRLVELTRQDSSATTVDTTKLGYAVADAGAEFLRRVGTSLDDSDAAHVAAGVEGVLYYLHLWAHGASDQATQNVQERWDRWLDRIRRSETRDRVVPTAGSVVDSTDRVPLGDRSRWKGYVVGASRGGNNLDPEADD